MHSSKSASQTSGSSRAFLRHFIAASRPKTLSATIVPVAVGAGVAHSWGYDTIRPILFLILVSATLIQTGTNLFNDALDFERGTDTASRLGPNRATQMGWFSAGQIKRLALGCFVGASLLAVPLVWVGGWTIVTIGLASLLSGYLYTGGKYPLAYLGLGEIFVLVFFGIIAVSTTVYLLTGRWFGDGVVAGIQVGVLATVLLAVNNLRDIKTDRVAGKMTLSARFGAQFGRLEVALLYGIAFGLLAYWAKIAPAILFVLFLPALLMACRIVRRLWKREASSEMNRDLHLAALTQMTFGAAMTVLLFCSHRA